MSNFNLNFYHGKRVLLTGHTGFKGAWMDRILCGCGAELTGYSRGSHKEPNLFELADVRPKLNHIVGDVRDLQHMKNVFSQVQPEIVIHMAAQPIVRDSYSDPVYTYETNVMGTVHVMECIRLNPCVKSVVIVTTDKVYENKEWLWGYREDEKLDGFDPYSNSKSCAELATHSYKNSFFTEKFCAVSTARAGNVIGGGDFAKDRLIPDCVRAVQESVPVIVRNPYSTRPYQHVLEPVLAYLMIAARQYYDASLAGWYNVGPDECDCINTGELVKLFCSKWGKGASFVNRAVDNAPHEANFLKLDCSKLKHAFDWQPRWHIDESLKKTVEWTQEWLRGGDIPAEMDRQINEYLGVNQ